MGLLISVVLISNVLIGSNRKMSQGNGMETRTTFRGYESSIVS